MSLSDQPVRHGTIETWGRTLLDGLADVESELWVVVVATLVADLYLTHLGLQLGFHEGNPVARPLIETFGIAALAAVKVGVLALAGTVRRLVPHRQRPAIPAGLALPWLGAVVINGALLLGA